MSKFEVEISDNLLKMMKDVQHKKHWTDTNFIKMEIEKLLPHPALIEQGIIEVKKVN